MCLAILGATKSRATVVPPASSFPEVKVATQTLYDPTINCDMLFEPNGFIKAIAWSDNGTAQSYIYAEDYYGNTSTINLPVGAINPDIAFANYEDLLTSTLVYEVAVTFTIGQKLYVEVYELQNVGTSSFALNTTPLYTVNISDDCTGLPHIDMWPDHAYHYIIGYASCHQFAVSFSEGSSGAHWGYLKAYVNDVDNWNITAPVFSLLSTGGTPIENVVTPDVACQYNIDLASTLTQRLNITFSSVSPPPVPLPTPAPSINYLSGTNSVSTLEYNYSSGTTTAGPTIKTLGNILFPRIESPGQFDEAFASTTPKWQIVYNFKGGSGGSSTDQVEGYNNIKYTPISSTDFPPPYQCMSACVAAGAEANGILTSPIGNNQYTVGFYPWGNISGPRTQSIFARNIDMLGGGGLMSTNTYEVNNNPVDFYWDFNRNMAISNSSNYGNDILSAWYNGTDIVYKHSTPDVMSFRAAPSGVTAPVENNRLLSPNPVHNLLNIGGNTTNNTFLITDQSGRTVLQGRLIFGQSIDVHSLASGSYYIRIFNATKSINTYSFTKN